MLLTSAFSPGWPIATPSVYIHPGTPSQHRVTLRPLRRTDREDWQRLRIMDERLLRPVEPTVAGDWSEAHSPAMWRATYRSLTAAARAGVLLPAVIEVDGQFAGQLTLGNIQHGAVSSCWIGYWVASHLQGQGVATAAVALGTDHAMLHVGVHRVEATVMPDNGASRRVLERTGYRVEGLLRRNLHIGGRWQDHLLVGLTAEETGAGHGRGVVRSLVDRGRLAYAEPAWQPESEQAQR